MIPVLTDIEAHITPERLNQGRQLFTDGRVTAPTIQRGGELITAIIPRAGSRPLRVYVRTIDNGNGVTIAGECSCPKKKNCEHVAAVLLQALADRHALSDDGDAGPPATRGKIRGQSRDTVKTNGPNAPQALLYTLHIDALHVLVETSVARRLKHGGYSLMRHFEPGRVNCLTPARFLQPVDLELLGALDRLPRASGAGIPRLDGPQSARLLEALLATGRCYLEQVEHQAPLGPGPVRRLAFDWQMDEFGYQRPAWRITPAADLLLPLSPPWYVDSKSAACGPLESGLPAALAHTLATHPPVAPEQRDQVHQTLVEAWPDASLPPLQRPDLETAPQVRPVPCLQLTTVEASLSGGWKDAYDFACLRFDYGGNEISRRGPDTRWVDGRVIRVQRDHRAEAAAAKQLRVLGFEQDEYWSEHTGEDCFFPDSDLMDAAAEAWLDFQVKALPRLRARGWRIRYDKFRYRLVEAGHWVCDVHKREQQDWFSIGLGVELDGQRVDLLPILLNFLRHFPRGLPERETTALEHFIVPLDGEGDEQGLLHLPAERLLPLLETLLEVYDGVGPTDRQDLRCNRVQLARLMALDQANDGPRLQWQADDDIRQLARRLQDVNGIPEVSPPAGLAAVLRPYQQQGLNWLQFLREFQLAGILADDMGLGKTVQALAHLLVEKEAGRADRPSLVIAPTSLMFNWRHEAGRFAPRLKVLVLHGAQRKERFPAIADHDLVITTYPLLARDKDTLLAQRYHLLILDEAQVIKNPGAQASRVVRELDARQRLCLTGTPLENHLGELWSLFDFLLPGLLGSSKQFRRFFRTPIEKYANEATAERLSRRIRPFLLRRTKQHVATELPEKTEIIHTVALENEQRELYETVRLAMHRRVREEIERQGLVRSHIVVLDALLKLRQVCCDPRLVKMDKAHRVKQSAKLDTLMELLPEMIEEGRRILVFSQFTTMLGLIEDELNKTGIGYVKLTGQTRERQTPVQRFQDGEAPLFLISLKAGGVGLNLTAADVVIHYDPWWNPAVERQASDRAHRIGQQQAVFVYKLICEGTLEEKIHAMQQRKQALADGLYQSGGNHEPRWNEQDLEMLFQPMDA
jgi:superfamily II DNA or RNA helicase